jgi:antitoxin PrlF
MALARVTSKGQITVPKAVRERLGIQPGDALDFHFQGGAIGGAGGPPPTAGRVQGHLPGFPLGRSRPGARGRVGGAGTAVRNRSTRRCVKRSSMRTSCCRCAIAPPWPVHHPE